MLTKILTVSGKPGLYKLVSTGKNLNVVESLTDGKRFPVYITEKVIALSDVSIYTEDGDVPLKTVLAKIKEKENGGKVPLNSKTANKELFAYFAEVLPNYDKDRVYASDIKKLINWYNILIENKINFETEEKESSKESADKEDISSEASE
ncbi:MAG TPA: DUF5606 domain-containing protein [Dysgonamonadaceae bacterium]|nr:DUF5606 domain-containing protein [Dysgonamonadaceae bacterium]